MITTIFLDNDGVLTDTEKYYWEANRTICQKYGYVLSRAEYQELFLRTSSGLRQVGKRFNWPLEKLAEVRGERDAVYSEYLSTGEIVLPGVAEGLARLAGRFRLCVVTSSPRSCFDVIHARTGFGRFFTKVVCEEDVENHKPEPDPYLKAMTLMNVTAAASIAVEDSQRGLRSALAAGLRCIAVPGELTKDQDFTGALAVVATFGDVVRMIQEQA